MKCINIILNIYEDIIQHLQEDMVCLSCTATGERVCLAAEGFGNRHCFLENIADKVKTTVNFAEFFSSRSRVHLIILFFQNIPPDLSQCVFVIEQALSVRALQELVTAAGSETVTYKLSANIVHSYDFSFANKTRRSRK